MAPVNATTKPASARTLSSRTVTRNPSGAPSVLGSSLKEYCVLYRFVWPKHSTPFRCAQCFGVVTKGVLCFGHTNRYFVFAGLFKLLQLLFCCRGEVDTFAAIDLGDNVFDTLTHTGVGCEHGLDGIFTLIEHVAKFLGKLCGTLAAIGPNTHHFGLGPAGLAEVFDPLEFFFGVLRELVDRHDHW